MVLHVEDDDAAAYLFRVALEDANITAVVYRVSDGEQALAFLRNLDPYRSAPRPQLAVIDLNLPRIDGWSVLEEVQKDPPVPAFVVTTSTRHADRVKAFSLGARAYVTKSSSFDQFVQEIKLAFAQKLPEWLHDEIKPITKR